MLGDHRDPGRVSASSNGRGSGRGPRAASSAASGTSSRRRVDVVARRLHDAFQHAQLGASLAVSSTSRSSACAAAPPSIAASAARTPGSRPSTRPGGVDRGARVEHREVARRTAHAGEDPPRGRRVGVRRAAGDVLVDRARQPDVLRRQLVGAQLAGVDLDHARRPRRAQLVEPVGARDDERPARAEPRERARDHLEEGGVGDADDLPRRAGGVRQRAEEVEDRAHGELLAHGDDEAGRAVVRGREHEAEADLLDAARDGVGREVDPHAERLEHVGRAGQAGRRAVAVLGHRAARARGDQRGGRRDVERLAAAARAGGVDQVVAARGHRARRSGASSRRARRARRRSPPWCAARSAPRPSPPRTRCRP